jgi:uncharacterized protein (UPF0332 family)
MRPEASDYLSKAHHCLANARGIAAAGFSGVAAREDYFAAFHAAEAYIFEKTGNAAKTHRGVRAQFSRLAQHEARIDTELLSFLREGYQLKAVADYGVGQATDSISSDDAASAIAAAGRFVECIAAVLS